MMEELKRCLTKRGMIEGENDDYFQAAVLLPLVQSEDGLAVLFEVRAGHLAWQPGEVCFPGGRIEATDLEAKRAAVRETSEELGLKETEIEVLGEMAPVISPIGVILYPYVGVLQGMVKANPDEVAEVFSVPLATLLTMKPEVGKMEMATRPTAEFPLHLLPGYDDGWKRRKNYTVYFYPWRDKVIWGLTALVLQRFLTIYREAERKKASRNTAG